MTNVAEKKKTEKIALIGFRGVGKSTLAGHMGRELSLQPVSLDEYIESREKCSIAEMVQAHGWNHFRDLELKYLRELSEKDESTLLDTGGGVLEGHDKTLSQEKKEILEKYFFSIYVYMDDEKILERLEKAERSAHRPVLGGEESIRQILTRRKPWYIESADLSVDISSMSPPDAARKILDALKKVRAYA